MSYRSTNWVRRSLLTSAVVALMLGAGRIPAAAQTLPACLADSGFQTHCFKIDGTIASGDNSGIANPDYTNDGIKTQGKELGPAQGNLTKVGVIDDAPTPMLALTSINNQTDLLDVYTQTAKDANNHIWYYFGYTKASSTGTAFVAIEFQQNPLNKQGQTPVCTYPLTAGGTCNPWRNRAVGDFMLLWDIQGSSQVIIKRTFTEDPLINDEPFLKPCPNGFPAVQETGSCETLNPQFFKVTYGGTHPEDLSQNTDKSRGEAAIDLSETVFGTGSNAVCKNFANIIPNTVTGNSDTADYKDTVLKDFGDVTNCGTVTITKVTDPINLDYLFKYKLSRAQNGGDVFNGTLDNDDCEDSVDVASHCAGRLTPYAAQNANPTDTLNNVLAGENFILEETEKPTSFTLTSIVCKIGTTSYGTFAQGKLTGIPVAVGSTTECTITNTFTRLAPEYSSTQYARLRDVLELTGINPDPAFPSDYGKVRFYLYSDATCDTSEYISDLISVGSDGKADTDFVVEISKNGEHWWAFDYEPGKALNQKLEAGSTCGHEKFKLEFTPSQ